MLYYLINSILYYKFSALLFVIFLTCVVMGVRTNKDLYKHLFFNAAAILLALFIYETYLTYQEFLPKSNHVNETITNIEGDPSLVIYDSILGYKPIDYGTFRAIETENESNQIIYDVTYSIEDNIRRTPGSNDTAQDCAIFLGCSNTFGSGMEDNATLPYFYGKEKDNEYRILNFGFNGYGSHQVLAQVQDLVPDYLQNCTGKKVAIYSLLLGHASRAAGYSSWDRYGPKYEIVEDNLVRMGSFSERKASALSSKINALLLKSRTYKRFFTNIQHKITDGDISRMIRIIEETERLLKSYGVEFIVFIHDIDSHILNDFDSRDRYQNMVDALTENNIKLFFLSDAIPDFDEHIDRYTISPFDRHPNALMNQQIAHYLATRL